MNCVYCGKNITATKEHVIPKGFINRMRPTGVFTYLDHAPIRIINSEITVRDVCAECNNGELSKLDSYALKLLLDVNNLISKNTKKIYFKYNKELLTRWLLKICYNSARADNAEKAIDLFQKNVGFMLKTNNPQNKLAIYAAFMGYDKIDSLPDLVEHLKKDRTFEFDWFRIVKSNNFGLQLMKTTSRMVLINSLVFYLIISDDEKEFEELCTKTKSSGFKFEELNNGKTWLKKDQDLMIESYKGVAILCDDFGKERKVADEKLRFLHVTREQIEKQDYSPIERLINECMHNRDILRDCLYSVIISVDGYDDENRQVYQVNEYQKYFYHVLLTYPEIVCLLNVKKLGRYNNPNIAVIWAAVNKHYVLDPQDDNSDKDVDSEKLSKIMESLYKAINAIANVYLLDGSFIDRATDNLNEFIGDILDIEELKNKGQR